jgi:hypothetical protein
VSLHDHPVLLMPCMSITVPVASKLTFGVPVTDRAASAGAGAVTRATRTRGIQCFKVHLGRWAGHPDGRTRPEGSPQPRGPHIGPEGLFGGEICLSPTFSGGSLRQRRGQECFQA